MSGIVAGIFQKLRERRLARAAKFLEDLKVRYHTFRILLANNEYSLDLMRSLDQSLRSGNSDLPEVTEELISVTYELVDGLNRLSGSRYQKLFETHTALAGAIRKELDTVLEIQAVTPACVALDDLSADLRGEVGGKAANLALLRKAGFPVPDGFSVTSVSCETILSANEIDLFIRRKAQKLEAGYSRGADFEYDAEEIRRLIVDAVLPENLEKDLKLAYERLAGPKGTAISVRSSALVEDRLEHSFAGQFKSVLNVVSFEGLKEALKEVIASNYSPGSISYRLNAGLSLARYDMAVLCQRMVQASSAGVLFTVDPAAAESGRMLISAVPGLGISAVGGSAPADIYRPARETTDVAPMKDWAQIAEKTRSAVSRTGGGIENRELSEDERNLPVLSEEEVRVLVRLSRRIENLIGKPQDIEWAVSQDGEIMILQSRDIRLPGRSRQAAEAARGEVLLRGGVCASPGRSVGKVKIVHSTVDFDLWRRNSAREPAILVLPQSMIDAAGFIADFSGVVVDLGNPADHLAVVAREYSCPMMTGAGKATQTLQDGQWIILDADMAMIFKAPEDVWSSARQTGNFPVREEKLENKTGAQDSSASAQGVSQRPEIARLRQLVEPLNLTDAYGPTFSIQECRSLHDLIRYTHEMAVLAMFQTGDEILESAEVLVRRLDGAVPLHFLIIDLGGGIAQGSKSFKVRVEDILSVPLLALWRGILTPGLRWSKPPPAAMVSGLLSRSILDSGSARPVGQQNYGLITRDYLNLNARVDYHFAMVDAVCGLNPRENHIRFRFKGGGTTAVQRERRALFITEVLKANNFFVDQRGDLVTASILETQQTETEDRLVMLGRLLGFSRLLDATMQDDTVHRKVAQAFLDGDYALDTMPLDEE